MGDFWQNCFKTAAIQGAFVAISSRIVGSAFRCLETLNPQFKQSNVGSDPKTVCIRELSTIGMAWGFALITKAWLSSTKLTKHWSDFKVQFLTSVIGTLIAESVGRLIAYRKLYRRQTQNAAPANTQPFAVNALHTSVSPVGSTPVQPGWVGLPKTQPYCGFLAGSLFR